MDNEAIFRQNTFQHNLSSATLGIIIVSVGIGTITNLLAEGGMEVLDKPVYTQVMDVLDKQAYAQAYNPLTKNPFPPPIFPVKGRIEKEALAALTFREPSLSGRERRRKNRKDGRKKKK